MDYRELTVSYTLRRLLVGYRTIIDKVQCLRDSLNLPHDDARQVALGGIQEVLFAFGLTVHAISGVGLSPSPRNVDEVRASFRNYGSISDKTDEQLLTIVETAWRLSIVTLCHFKMDALVQNLL